MNEKPILFSTEMVQAILEGRKTQTRRIIKHGFEKQPSHGTLCWWDMKLKASAACFWENEKHGPLLASFEENGGVAIKCPYARFCDSDMQKSNQMLWVRETHMYIGRYEQEYIFKAGYPNNLHPELQNIPSIDSIDWKPSIHMPKEAARIWLKITSIRIERLHEITEEDAVSEGAPVGRILGWGKIGGSHREGFIELWEKINGFDSWTANPWVWVIEFEVASTTGRP